jgi:hypothetical protein
MWRLEEAMPWTCAVSEGEMLPLVVINVTEKLQLAAKTLARCRKGMKWPIPAEGNMAT